MKDFSAFCFQKSSTCPRSYYYSRALRYMTATLHDKKIDMNHSYRHIKAVDYSTKFTNLYSEDFFYVFQSLFWQFLYKTIIFMYNLENFQVKWDLQSSIIRNSIYVLVGWQFKEIGM